MNYLIAVLDTREIKGVLDRILSKRNGNIKLSTGKQGVEVVYHDGHNTWYKASLTKGAAVFRIPWTAVVSLEDVKQAVKMAGADGLEIKDADEKEYLKDYIMLGNYRVQRYGYDYPEMPACPVGAEVSRIVMPVKGLQEISKFTSAGDRYINNIVRYDHERGQLIATDACTLAALNPDKLKCSEISARDFDFKVGVPNKVFGKAESVEIITWAVDFHLYTQYSIGGDTPIEALIKGETGSYPTWQRLIRSKEDGIKVELLDDGVKGWAIGLLQTWKQRKFNVVYVVAFGGRLALTPIMQKNEFTSGVPWYDETAIGYITGDYQAEEIITQFKIDYLLDSLQAVADDGQDVTMYLFKDVSANGDLVTYRAQLYGSRGFIIIMPKYPDVSQVEELMQAVERKCEE